MDIYAQAVTQAKRTAQRRVVASLRSRDTVSIQSLCPQNVPSAELGTDGKLFYKRGSQEKYFSLDRKSGTFCFDIQPLLLLGKSAASGLLSRLLGSSR